MMDYKPYDYEPFITEIKDCDNWEDEKLKYHRIDIADYLYNINNGQCFYCKSKISRNITKEHIEHIVDKDDYPQFTYNPKNLTISCPNCNTSKGTKSVFKNNIDNNISYDQYPYKTEEYSIIHAYLDNYEECMVPGIIYEPFNKNEKGIYTIRICDINNPIRVEEREKINNKNNLIGALITQDLDNEEIIMQVKRHVNNILEGKDVNLIYHDTEEYNNRHKVLYFFIEDLIRDKVRIKNGIIENICKFNESELYIFRKFYSIIKAHINLKNKTEIKNWIDDFDDEGFILNNIEHIIKSLETLNSLIGKEKYKNAIRILIDFENYSYVTKMYNSSKYSSNNKIKKNISLYISNIIMIYKLFFITENKDLKVENIKKLLKISKTILDIKLENLSTNIS